MPRVDCSENDDIVYFLSTVDVDPNKYCGCSTVDRPQCGCCVDLEEIIQEDYTGINS